MKNPASLPPADIEAAIVAAFAAYFARRPDPEDAAPARAEVARAA